jgi:hypothetical protein
MVNTPSGASVWKCGFTFKADPDRWTAVTLPLRPFRTPSHRARQRWNPSSART